METSFGYLLTRFRQRKSGLTQERLAHQMGYDAALLARMVAGKKDLTGPSGRPRVLNLLCVLAREGVLTSLDEADALLLSARLHPLHRVVPSDSAVIDDIQNALAARKAETAHA